MMKKIRGWTGWLEILPWRKRTSRVKNEENEIGCTSLNLPFSHQEEHQKLFRKMSRRYSIFRLFDNRDGIRYNIQLSLYTGRFKSYLVIYHY